MRGAFFHDQIAQLLIQAPICATFLPAPAAADERDGSSALAADISREQALTPAEAADVVARNMPFLPVRPSDEARYLTLLLALWHPHSRRLVFANAGSFPPLVCRKGEFVKVRAEGVPLGLLLGRADFSNLFIDLSGKHPASMAEAKAQGLPVIAYGVLINDIVTFLIIAFVVFLIVKAVNRLRAAPPPPPNTKDCPRCLTAIPLAATRCAACCADLPATAR